MFASTNIRSLEPYFCSLETLPDVRWKNICSLENLLDVRWTEFSFAVFLLIDLNCFIELNSFFEFLIRKFTRYAFEKRNDEELLSICDRNVIQYLSKQSHKQPVPHPSPLHDHFWATLFFWRHPSDLIRFLFKLRFQFDVPFWLVNFHHSEKRFTVAPAPADFNRNKQRHLTLVLTSLVIALCTSLASEFYTYQRDKGR